ncbi:MULTISPECIES: MFS transporter [unclassified Streptomyces]|uniref:MFS transporter n=1 Tax=unclassified Streptomyces TaxID=2593676 RepID=UPI002E355B5F|nr:MULTISPECIES: MFS transporter [unclassified Streptomyces]WUB92690.1 MHS family MFS transporter [Streptomyces sp. NBC_00569]
MTRQSTNGDAPSPAASDAVPVRRVVTASLAGNMLEWYDFFLYTTAAAMVLGSVFFPSGGHPLLGTIAALAGHAVGFAARPIGGLVFGHIGDRRGRKTALLATISLMGGATFCMGLLPSYSTAGIVSPLLLVVLRILQGAAAGGEWGGGVLIITENVPPNRRGFLASFSSCGMGIGFVLSSLALWLAQQASGDAFAAWGWRLPFLASAVIFAVGLYIRRNLGETESFEETTVTGAEAADKAVASEARSPLREVLRRHPRQILFAMALRFADSGASYIFMSFSLVYGAYVGISSTVLLWAGIVGMTVDSVMMVVFGRLSDRVGRRPVYLGGTIGIIVWAVPFFLLMDTGETAAVWLAFVVGHIAIAAMIGVQPSYFAELFSTRTRYSGMAIGHELSSAVAGGLSPVAATALLAATGHFLPVALLTIAMALVATVALVFFADRTATADVAQDPSPSASDTSTETDTHGEITAKRDTGAPVA